MKRELTTILFEGEAPRLEVDEAELRVTAGPDKGASLRLGAGSIRLGSDPDCDLVLRDPTVSSHHAEISLGVRGYGVRDLGSKNGVRLDGVLVDRAPLAAGVTLQLGSTRVAVRAGAGRQIVELARRGVLADLVAHSVPMRALAAALEKLAASDATLLLEGETGSGKEVVAHAAHALSPRARGPFVVLDCGAIPASMLAAEIFGHERGAFTQADRARPGLLEEAEGGTLFLDEIGELPLEVQPALLRAIAERRTRRLGASEERSHDVRIIAATHRNLAEEVRAGRFREDLFYRLGVARLRVPPLRDRREDIPILAEKIAASIGTSLGGDLAVALAAHDWPGNVRELRNAIERVAVQGPAALRELGATAPAAELPPLVEARRRAADEFERAYLERALAAAGGNLSRAAELAGVSRQVITSLARKHGLRAIDRR